LTVTLANGVPQFASLYNTPYYELDRINETGLYVLDSISIGRRWTINAGGRYDRSLMFLPPQQSAAGTFVGVRSFPRSPNYIDNNDFSPRFSVAFDPGASGKSVIRASYSRFVNLQGASLVDQFNPNSSSHVNVTFTGLGTVPSDPVPNNYPLGLGSSPIFQAGGQFNHVDPNLKRVYTQQITIGYERQLLNDVRFSVGYYFRNQGNYQTSFNTALATSNYSPLTVTNGLTGQPMTIYNLAAALVSINPYTYVTNAATDPHNTYNGLEFNVSKRMTKNWLLLAGFTAQKWESDKTLDPTNPNNDIYYQGNLATNDSPYVGKLSGQYKTPWGITVSSNFQSYVRVSQDSDRSLHEWCECQWSHGETQPGQRDGAA
jgi:hypothetical protein